MDIYIASNNSKKVDELERLLGGEGLSINIHSAKKVGGMPEVEENGKTFEANARLKVEALEKKVPDGAWILGDDSGLCVNALNGAPGIYSARYSGEDATDHSNNEKLLRELKGKDDRGAYFYCALVLRQKMGAELVFSGMCRGKILEKINGEAGFGYDPLFVPNGCSETFAQMGPTQKDLESHRGGALRQLIAYIRSEGLLGR